MLYERLNDNGKNWRSVFKVRIPSNRAQHLPNASLSTPSLSLLSTTFFVLAQKMALFTSGIIFISLKR